ncbi:subtilase family domain-containing protein [Purpureocillium lilacinum]|uniref:Subtilase family domain-containing protein n=1 Tax=Purpureocillium lilacinum TaxID=33203 RepID=A0A179EYU7_PURLI|nr:subtilase family domain-containing protein [Purpureocillium lilacinum]OAQ58351.1 subtilase family domain-containing protein [Purpureocillium lilacinum]
MASDDGVTQTWLSLTAVLGLFAADLPWYASQLNREGLSVTDRGSIEDFRVFFRHEIKQMAMLLKPDRGWSHLSEDSAKELGTKLGQVLQLLESQIDDEVVEVCTRKYRSEQRKVEPPVDNVVTSTLFWAASKIRFFARVVVFSSTEASPEQTIGPAGVYPKLKALKVLLDRLGDSGDPVFRFGYLVSLGNTKDEYKNALSVLEQFNRFLESLDNTRPIDASTNTRKAPINSSTRAEIDIMATGSLGQPTTCSYLVVRVQQNLTGMKRNVLSPKGLNEVCRAVRQYKQTREPLHMILGGENLFDMRAAGGYLEYPPFTCRLSLGDLLDRGYFKSAYEGGLFTPRSKRALVLNLAQCLLYLFGGKWLQREWEAFNLVFLCEDEHQTRRLVDMHRPYVLCSLSPFVPTIRVVRDNSSAPHHPAVLAFAKLLVNIERGRRISDEECEWTDGRVNEWLTISTILKTKLSGSLTGHYTTAVQSCLDFSRMSRRDANETDADYIYQNIVFPLQQELADYPRSHLEHVELQLPVTDLKDVAEATRTFPASPALHLARTPIWKASSPIREVPVQDIAFSVVLFDDFENGEDNPASQLINDRAVDFFSRLDKWRDGRRANLRLLQAGLDNEVTESRQTRIAILDTGIDVTNPVFKAALQRLKRECARRNNPIKVTESFVDDDWRDGDGHGTLTASLLLQVAPTADIYVGKIAAGRTTGQCNAIAEAITKAIDKKQWNVDIIVMPFGVDREREVVETAINNAYHRGKILIASAANSGGNTGRAYPAKDERVICMHASDGNGNDYHGINPSPLPNTDNFTTLGLGIRFYWANQDVWKSGTSYSAPVAAGIAANVLDFVRHPALGGKLPPEQLKELGTGAGMRKMFRLLAGDVLRRGYNYLEPWSLWKDGLDEADY